MVCYVLLLTKVTLVTSGGYMTTLIPRYQCCVLSAVLIALLLLVW